MPKLPSLRRLTGHDGETYREVPVIHEVGTLFVHPSIGSDSFTISHTPTGTAVIRGLGSSDTAFEVAKRYWAELSSVLSLTDKYAIRARLNLEVVKDWRDAIERTGDWVDPPPNLIRPSFALPIAKTITPTRSKPNA